MPPTDDSGRGPRPIGSLVSRLLARTGWDRERAGESLEEAWRSAAPETLREASRAGTVRRGVLEVFVSHSALVQEMGFHKRQTLLRLAELLPDEGITDMLISYSTAMATNVLPSRSIRFRMVTGSQRKQNGNMQPHGLLTGNRCTETERTSL